MDIAIVGTKHKEPNKAEGFEHAVLDFENNRRNYGASNAVRFVALFVRLVVPAQRKEPVFDDSNIAE